MESQNCGGSDIFGAREDYMNHEVCDDDVDMPSELAINDSDAEDADVSEVSGSSAFADEDALVGDVGELPDVNDFVEPVVHDEAEVVVFMAGTSHEEMYDAAEKKIEGESGPMLDAKIKLLAETLASAQQLSMTKFADQCRRGYIITERSARQPTPYYDQETADWPKEIIVWK
jgi:hypothetical protein